MPFPSRRLLRLLGVVCAIATVASAQDLGAKRRVAVAKADPPAVAKAANGTKAAKAETDPTGPQPLFVPVAGAFVQRVSVELRPPTPGAVIRYTLDGSEPGASSAIFSKPLVFTRSTYLRARVFEPGGKTGPIAGQTYTILAPEVGEFSSDLPLVIIQSFGSTIEHDQKTTATARFIPLGANGRTSPTAAAEYDGLGTINYRGFSSLRYVKRSYSLKTRDDGGNKNPVSLLGLPKDSDWVLYAPYADKTLVRNALAYDLGRQLGHWAPRARFVELFVSEESGQVSMKHYRGVYMLIEKIKRDKDRVNIAKLGPEDNSEPNITGGYIFKKDHDETPRNVRPSEAGWGGSTGNRYGYPTGPGGFPADPKGFIGNSRLGWGTGAAPAANERRQTYFFNGNRVDVAPNMDENEGPVRREMTIQRGRSYSDGRQDFVSIGDYLMTRRNSQFFLVEPEPDKATAAQKNWLLNHLNAVEQVIYGPDFADPKKGYAAYLDVDSFIDHHLMVELTKNIDGFRFSTFFNKDRGGKIKMEPIWDYDLAFGNATGKQGYLSEYWYWPQLDDQQYTWFRRLFEDPDFAQRYVDRYAELRQTAFHPTNVLGRMDSFLKEVKEAQKRNFDRWSLLGREIWPNYYTGETYEDEVNWMRNWMRRRIAWIDRQFVATPTPASVNGKTTLSTSVGKIFYTTDGSDPRMPGGQLSPKAKELAEGAPLPDGKVFARVQLLQPMPARGGGGAAGQTVIRWSAPWRSKA